jgi:dethiobiotin synthetase
VSRNVWLLIETAGAAFTPLAPGVTNVDLAIAFEPCFWLLVAPDALGVLHDVTVTLAALEIRARTADALVLSAARPADASTGTNADELRRLGIANPVAALAWGVSNLDEFARTLIARATAQRYPTPR